MTAQHDACPDCQVAPGGPHHEGCDVARCPVCGTQRLQCSEHQPAEMSSIWTGRWPGDAECERLGWYCYWDGPRGWVSCSADRAGAVGDLNRLLLAGLRGELAWSRDKQEWVNV